MTMKVSQDSLANENGEEKDTATQTEKGLTLERLKLCRASAELGTSWVVQDNSWLYQVEDNGEKVLGFSFY